MESKFYSPAHMRWQDHPTNVIIAALVGGVTIAGAPSVAYITSLNTKIQTLELSQGAAMPDLLKSLREASEELQKQMVTFRRIEELEKSEIALKKELESTSKSLTEAKDEIEKLSTQLTEANRQLQEFFLESGEFTLREGTSKSIAGHALVVGATDIGMREATVVINNEKRNLAAGNSINIPIDGKTYTIALTEINWPGSAVFTFVVKK